MSTSTIVEESSLQLINEIEGVLRTRRFSLEDEISLHQEIDSILALYTKWQVQREYWLDNGSKIDFLIDNKIGIEVKIKGNKKAIYRQCLRYLHTDSPLQGLILLSNQSLGFPSHINSKPCRVIKLGLAWL